MHFGVIAGKQVNYGFLVAQSDSHVLASPRVAMQENSEADIHIGDKFPLENSYLDMGLQLNVQCKLGADGRIVSHLRGRFLLLKEVSLIQTTAFESDFELLDGQTLMIGGLATPEQIRAASLAVPSLRDLPIQGSLFRPDSGDRQLYLMITPSLMR